VRQPARWTVGADTEAVLAGLGVDESQVAKLRQDGVV
jgi:crotonobetainyl-CoA:carnitine CoA-transferase CaiB-like acyl-CoA transferase